MWSLLLFDLIVIKRIFYSVYYVYNENIFYLVVNGNWGEWGNFTECGDDNMKNRTRLCDSPAAVWGGLDCLVTGTNDTYEKSETEVVKCKDICPSKYIENND